MNVILPVVNRPKDTILFYSIFYGRCQEVWQAGARGAMWGEFSDLFCFSVFEAVSYLIARAPSATGSLLRVGMAVVLCLAALCVGLLSCRKLPSAASPAGQLKSEVLTSLDAIPLEYGNLVDVTSDSSFPAWAQLWFEKADKTIVVVRVSWADGAIQSNATIIPRR